MKKSELQSLGEIIVSNARTSSRVSRLVKKGLLRKIAPRLYSSNLEDDPCLIVDRNLYHVLGGLFPGAVLSHRSAFEIRPVDGHIFLTYPYDRIVHLPGLTVHLLRGAEASIGTFPYPGGLSVSSEARALLENLQPSRARSGPSRTLSRDWMENRLEKICRRKGERALDVIRDEARALAPKLGRELENEVLQSIISALLGSGEPSGLQNRAARSRAAGLPLDAERLRLFDALHVALARRLFTPYQADPDAEATRNIAFFEAYFSNHIEGTRFEVREAMEMLHGNLPDPRRPEDSHDIIGTFNVVSDHAEMSRTPNTADALVDLLTTRHTVIMAGRPGSSPGAFKDRINRAGSTVFVRPDLVEGTLQAGFELMMGLREPLARAIYMMFLVSEVHPFTDGNGRMARIMMNAELVSAASGRILLPIVSREDYLLALRALSRGGRTEPLIQLMEQLQEFTASLDASSLDTLRTQLEQAGAFAEPREGRLRPPRIRRPGHSGGG